MTVAYIALGANIPGPAGSPAQTLAATAERLTALGNLVARSSLYSTAPVGYADQPRFINAVVAIETALGPRELLAALSAIERDFGRDRNNAIPNGPRSLDLDILLYGDSILRDPNLEIPHPRFAQREFVLIPLAEIAPEIHDPRSGVLVKELLERLQTVRPPGTHQTDNEIVAIEHDRWHAGSSRAVDGSDHTRANIIPPDHR